MEGSRNHERGLLEEIRAEVANGFYRFTLHAGDRMTERHIAVGEVEEAVLYSRSEIVEDYPGDPRGQSCLVLGTTKGGRALHIHCSYPPGMTVVTAYEPDPAEWIHLRKRK